MTNAGDQAARGQRAHGAALAMTVICAAPGGAGCWPPGWCRPWSIGSNGEPGPSIFAGSKRRQPAATAAKGPVRGPGG